MSLRKPAHHVQPKHLRIEGFCGRKITHLQMDVTDTGAHRRTDPGA